MSRDKQIIGEQFEKDCANLLDMQRTWSSGATLDNADLTDDHLLIECKVKNTVDGISIPKSLIEKVKEQATKWRRDWAIASRTKAGDFIVLPVDVFAEIYEEYKKHKRDIPYG